MEKINEIKVENYCTGAVVDFSMEIFTMEDGERVVSEVEATVTIPDNTKADLLMDMLVNRELATLKKYIFKNLIKMTANERVSYERLTRDETTRFIDFASNVAMP